MEPDEGMENVTEVAKGTAWSLTGTFVNKIISFLYTIYIAYVVSQADIGIFNLALGILAIVTVWKDLGLPTALARYIPYFESRGEHAKAMGLLKSTYLLNALSGLLLSAAVWLLSDAIASLYGNPPLGEALRLLSLFVLLDNLQRVGGCFLQGKMRIAEGQFTGTAQNVAKFAFTIALVSLWGANFASLAVAYVASTFVGLAVTVPFVMRSLGKEKLEGALAGKELWSEIAPFGLTLMVIQTFYTIISATDKAILGYLAPAVSANEMVAVYSMAVAFAGNVMVFPGTVGGIFLPVISRLVGREDMHGMRRVMGTAQRWVLFITLPMAAVMMAFASEMLSTFFGRSYGGGGTTMTVFMAGLIFAVFAYTANLALAGMRLVRLELKIVAFAALLNVALNFALIPQFGMEGAALAGAASLAASGMLFLYYGKKMLGFETPRKSYLLLLAGAAVFALLLVSKPVAGAIAGEVPSFGPEWARPYLAKSAYLLLLGMVSCISFAVFGAIALALKCFEREDVAIMRKVAKKAFVPQGAAELAEKILMRGVEDRARK